MKISASWFAVVALATGCNLPGFTDSTGRAPPGSKSVFTLGPDDFQSKQSALVSSQTSAMSVSKGDILYISSSGTLTSAAEGIVGPAGSDAWGGPIFQFTNRRVFGLYGRIGEDVFFIGDEAVIIVPQDGDLELIVNTCTTTPGFNCDATGGFATDVYSKLKSGVTLADVPALTDNAVTASTTFTVDPGGTWQSTGIELSKGQKTFISVTGSFTDGSETSSGDGSYSLGGTSYVLTNRFVDRVFGRVGDTIVDLGAHGTFLSPAAGTLELVVNHGSQAVSGSLTVNIGQGVVPARGLFGADLSAFSQTQAMGVPLDGQWHPAGISVHAGDPLVASATGQLTGSAFPTGSGDAWGQGAVGGLVYPLLDRPVDALFARINGEAVLLGTANTILAPGDGPVEVMLNVPPSCPQSLAMLCDVHGTVSATLSAP